MSPMSPAKKTRWHCMEVGHVRDDCPCLRALTAAASAAGFGRPARAMLARQAAPSPLASERRGTPARLVPAVPSAA